MKYIMPIVLVLLILGAGIYMISNRNGQPVRERAISEAAVSDSAPANASDYQPKSSYGDYSAERLLEATANEGKAVIFFHAPWCPFCREAEAEFQANSDQIPSDVTILKTDYDTSTDLRKKYGITSQHTFVQVDGEGNEISKWIGGGTQELIDNVR